MSRYDKLFIGILAAVIACALLAAFPDHSAQNQARQYCKMVHDKAWPDFHHVYAKQCKPNGKVNWKYVNGN